MLTIDFCLNQVAFNACICIRSLFDIAIMIQMNLTYSKFAITILTILKEWT